MRVLRWLSNIWMFFLILNLLLAVVLIGGRFVLPHTASAPTLRAAEPADGAINVAVRARPRLTFDGPMNPRSVEAALRIEPALPYTIIWDPDLTTLTISPTLNLRPSTEYQIQIHDSALGRQLSALATPATITFRTVAAPAVQSTIPADSASAPPFTPIIINFSRAMVAPDAVLREASFPALHFEPPISGRALWVDQSTLLFRIDTALRPGQSYQASLDASLSDLEGGPLGQPFSWSFRVDPPQIIATNPPDGDRAVALRTPLTISLTQALPTTELQQAFHITPSTSGRLTSAILPDQTQIVTFTPTIGWQPGTEYQASLRFSTSQTDTLRFTAAPRLALSGRFPGEGQILPTGQQIRLVFTTPVAPELLQGALRFDPPTADVQVTGTGSELRIGANLRAATAYTLTLAPDLADSNGDLLGIPTTIRFTTAPALSALSLPEISGHLAQFLPNQPVALLVRRTNTSALFLDLFEMDEATVVRTRIFNESDWQNFSPERYQRPLRRHWAVPLSDPLNAAVEDRLAITTDSGSPLAPGIYYLRIRTPEGPRADLIFAVTRTQLELHVGESGGLIWATDAISGTTIPSLPLALYQDDALILEGAADQDGILRFSITGGQPHTYTALARDQAAAIGAIGPLTLPPPDARDAFRLTLITGGGAHQPGDTLPIAGFVRQVITSTLALPLKSANVRILLHDPSGRVYADTLAPIDANGSYSAEVALRKDLPPGSYRLTASLGATTQDQVIQIQQLSPQQERLELLLNQAVGGPPSSALVLAETSRGEPLGNTSVAWTLSATVAPPPLPAGYLVGISGIADPALLSGRAYTNPSGQLTLPISATTSLASLPLRYRLSIQSPTSTTAASFMVEPASRYIGIRTMQQIVPAGGSLPVELLVVDQAGKPISSQAMLIQLFSSSQLNERPLLTRRVLSSRDGTVKLDIDPPGSGAFTLRVTARDPQQRVATSEIPIWAAGKLSGAPATPQLIPDRRSYLPGDTVTLLPLIPREVPSALLLIAHGSTLDASIRAIQPGQPFTVTLPSATREQTQITLLTPNLISAPTLAISTSLPLATPTAPPIIRIQSDLQRYAPGTTATLTTTITAPDGSPVTGNLIVALFADAALSALPTSEDLQPHLLAPNTRAIFWSGPRSVSNGTLTLSIPMPLRAGQLHAIAWAADTQTVVAAQTELAVVQPAAIYLDPPAFLRPGDQAELTARIVSHTSLTQTVALTLQSDQFIPVNSAPFSQTITLAPYATARIVWKGSADGNTTARVTMSALSGRDSTSDSVDIPLLIEATSVTSGAALVTDSYHAQISGAPQAQLIIDIAGTPDAIALNAAQAIAAWPAHSTRDHAALLLISAPISATQELAAAQIAELVAAQHADGGWGWWPQLPSDEQSTAIVLEALAAAEAIHLRIPERTLSAGLAWAERTLNTSRDPAVRAPLAYVLALHGRAPTSAISDLRTQLEALSPRETALLLLALPADQAQARVAAAQHLLALATRDQGQLRWGDAPDQPDEQIEISAIALQSLVQSSSIPDDIRQAALAALASWRTPDGWGSSYSTARALLALRSSWPRSATTLQYTLDLDAERLLAQTGGIASATQRLHIPTSRLSATSVLTITTSAGPLLTSYQVISPLPAPPPSTGAVLILREARSTISGQVATDTTQADQPTTIRLTLIVQRQLEYAQIEIPLPPGALIQRFVDTAAWPFVARSPDRLIFAQNAIAPGVYELRYQIQPGVSGQFSVPAPTVRDRYGKIISTLQNLPR